jgi:hypothetical protein
MCKKLFERVSYPFSVILTRRYEEKSLGVFEENPEEDQEPSMEGTGSRRDRIGKYLGWHIRRQLSYGEFLYGTTEGAAS